MKNKFEKKIILVIVEGPSDETSLGRCLQAIFSSEEVAVKVMFCDITTVEDNFCSDISARIGNIINDYLSDNPGLRRDDILRIIHIVDTDGVFLADRFIFKNSERKTVYSLGEIKTYNVRAFIKTRRNKKRNLKVLLGKKKINGVTYNIYYMSCNLEHALHGKMNCTDWEKRKLSEDFDDKYGDDIEKFKKFICESDFSEISDYDKSWALIQKEKESLKRHTNLGLCWQ